MRGLRLLIRVAAVAAALAWLIAIPGEGYAKEAKNLLDDKSLSCTGSQVGKVIQKPGTTTVKVKITSGTASTTRQVFEVCQSGTGCHAGCGFKSLGTITTDGSGFAKKKFTRQIADPVHYDICPGTTSGCSGGNYFAGLFTSASGIVETGAVSGGDPSSP